MHCESEIFNIAKKYGISSIDEFEERYKKGEIEEEGTWEDFLKLDHLEAEKESIKSIRSSPVSTHQRLSDIAEIYFYSEFMYKELSYRLGMVTMKMPDTG